MEQNDEIIFVERRRDVTLKREHQHIHTICSEERKETVLAIPTKMYLDIIALAR